MSPLNGTRESASKPQCDMKKASSIKPPIKFTDEMTDHWIVVSLEDRSVLGIGRSPQDALAQAERSDSDRDIALHFVSGTERAMVL